MIDGRAPLRLTWRRALRAQARDAAVLLKESRSSLLLFLVIVLGGAVIFALLYRDPHTGQAISFQQALYASFTLLFLQGSLDFPENGLLQALYFIIPIAGLFAVVDGFIHFGAALTNKNERGQKWQAAVASTFSGHVIICGFGKTGYRVALELLKLGREVIAVDQNGEGRFVAKALELGIPVILADARRQETLLKAGIERADAVIPCTDDELTNLDVALDARELNPEAKIVMRMFDPDLARRIEQGFGIQTAYSVSALAAPTIAAAAMRVDVKSSFYGGDRLLHISQVEVHAGSALDGLTVQQLESRLNLSVISYIEDGQTRLHPEGGLALRAGCQALVLAGLDGLQRLKELNR
ncbi:MAG: potassium channel family protein [Chloroflexota bacterium]